MADQVVVDPSEVQAIPQGGWLQYPPAAPQKEITVDPSEVGALYDPAALAALEKGPEVRVPGVPLYQTAPGTPEKELPPIGELGRYGGEAALGRQVQSGYYGGLAGADLLGANIAHLLDTAATKISGLTGTEKGGLFKQMEEWAREQQRLREEQAAEYAGGRKDLPSQVIRGATSAVTSLPITAAATTLGGPVLGMAGLGALETANQGPLNMLKGAAEGAVMGKFLDVMGPYGRMIRMPVVAGAELFKNLAQGVEPETAFANALNMGALTGLGGPGRKSILPESMPEGLRFESRLNPTQQAAVDYLRGQGVPLTGGQQTGNRFLTAIEATTAHTPLGAQKAREFHVGTEGAMRDLAGELAGQAHGEPVSPYEAGTIVGDTLTHSIAELAGKANQAYEKAWEHAGDPAYDKKVQIKTKSEPVLDAAGEPTGKTKQTPVYADVNMPVDVRWMKAIARDQIPKYEYLPAAERAQSAAYSILKGILKGNDHISAQQAEEALKGLKAEVGYGTDPNMRNVAQGVAAQMIPRLQKAIDAAVGETGSDNAVALQEGRKLHSQKMDFADVQKKLREEPVQAFGQLTQGRDSGVNYLKEVARRAPESLPALGRAYLDTLFDKAMKEGGWMRTEGVFRDWDKLGDQTKALLFPGAGQVNALDRFFLAQKITAERINTSGTALVKEAQDAGTNALKWLKGKVAGDILFSPKGIKFLTGIAQDPPRTPRDVDAIKARAAKVFGTDTKPPEEPPQGPPTGGGSPPNPPQAPSGSTGGAAPSEFPYLHATTPDFTGFEDPSARPYGHGLIYFSDSRRFPGRMTQAEHVAAGPFGGKLVRANIEGGKLFDPYNDPAAANILQKLVDDGKVQVSGGPGSKNVEYTHAPALVEEAQKHGYNRFNFYEPSVQGFSHAVTDPSLIRIAPEAPSGSTSGAAPGETPGIGQGGAESAGAGSLQERLQTIGDEALERVKKSGTFQGRTLPSLFPAEVTKDMVTWGAARIANGAIDFGKWSKAMLDDASAINPEAVAKVRAMLPQLYKDSQKEYEHHAQTIGAQNIADLPTIMKYYRAGKEGKQWYNFVRPALQPLFGENTDLFLKMFAATSPNTKVTQNVLNAVKAYRQFLMGEPFTGMPAHVDNLNRAVAGVKMSGPKVGAFGPNLLGDLNPVTVDLWMARAILGRDTVTPLQSKLVDYMTSQAAQKVGLKPAEMQAAIWTGIKKLRKSRDTSAPPEVIVNEYLDKNPDVRKLFEDSMEMSKEHFKGLQSKQAPAKPPRN